MNNAAMAFDAGTWWLVGLLATALTGAVVFLVKRTLFSRVDGSVQRGRGNSGQRGKESRL